MIRERIQQIHTRIAELTQKANQLYGINLPRIDVRCDLRGKCAGMAGYRVWGQFYVRFNIDMIGNDSWEHIIRETVPHEVAHIVCFFRKVDDGHGRAWQATCRALGGTGKRYHDQPVTYAKGRTYYYRTTVGSIVALSAIRHRRVQQGGVYVFHDGGRVTRNCGFSLEAPGT